MLRLIRRMRQIQRVSGRFFAGDATIVLADNVGSACAATDFQDATNSKAMGNNTFASAFREFDIDEVSNAKGHGEATNVQGTLAALLSAYFMIP